jgi:tetratricopeptide (TPR) repeat protein
VISKENCLIEGRDDMRILLAVSRFLAYSLTICIVTASISGTSSLAAPPSNSPAVPPANSAPVPHPTYRHGQVGLPKVSELDANGLPASLLESLLRSKKVRQARIVLSRTPAHPNDEQARMIWKAACFSAEGQFDEAVAEFRKVANLESARGYLLYLAASAYIQTQDFARARELCDLAIKRDHCHECYELRATCYNAEKRYIEAADDYQVAAAYSQHHAGDFYCEASQALLKANQPGRALQLIDKALSMPNTTKVGSLLLAKGTCLENLGRYPEAVAILSKAIGTNHEGTLGLSRFWLVSCLTARARCYEKMGRKGDAAADRKTLDKMSTGIADDLLSK